MAKQIIYNSNIIPFNFADRAGDNPKFMIDNNVNISSSGVHETISKKAWVELEFRANFSQSVYLDLIAWFSYVSQGNEFDVALDSTAKEKRLLAAPTVSGQKRIYIEPTGFGSGEDCLLRSEYGFTYEVVTVDTVDSDSILVEDDLKFSYILGDTFRHFNYFPNMLLTNPEEFSALRTGGLDQTNAYRSFLFKLMENRTV